MDDTARVWDGATGELVAALQGHRNSVVDAQFSPDGQRIVTASEDKTARVWEASIPGQPAPRWFSAFLKYAAEREFDPKGELQDLTSAEALRLRQQLTEETASGSDRYSVIARWLLLPASERPIRPGAAMTQFDAADSLITPEAGRAEVEHAYELNPAHPLICLALARFETKPESAAFLRRYGLARVEAAPTDVYGPREALRERAKALLAESPDGGTTGAQPASEKSATP
jgi:hypothetical protein